MDTFFTAINHFLETIMFFDILFGTIEGVSIPFLVAWLIVGGVYMTLKMNFINLRILPHSINIIRGKYLTNDLKGEIAPFAALTTALSATVGLGNIAGVAIAVSIGGAGATFWMILAGFLGMTLKFTEVTLSVKYRTFLKDGSVMGGAMEYLSRGLEEKGFTALGKYLAIFFAILLIGGSIGGGNAFQTSQALVVVQENIPFFKDFPYIFGFIIAGFVGAVIIGGIKRISTITESIVPFMVILYVGAALYILISNYELIPHAFGMILSEAFMPQAVEGGMIGVIVQGFQRAVFSSEAGIGSAPIAHAPSRVKYPVQQGFVALYEPFIDTVIVCTMTALVIVITGVCGDAANAELIANKQGAALTSVAFGTVLSWFPMILAAAIALFAFSTMISWSYYGERAWVYLFGSRYSIVFKLLFLAITVISTIVSSSLMVDFSFMLMLMMALPNIFGLYMLSGDVKRDLQNYLHKLKNNNL